MKTEQLKEPLALSDGGVLVPERLMKGQVAAVGEYIHRKNGGAWTTDRNTVTIEWLNYLLETGHRNGTKFTSWYMTLFGTGQTPSDDWTASSFASLNTENTSETEGYINSTRPQWSPGAASNGQFDNTSSPVTFTFATSDTVTIGGIALLSDNTRGGSAGVLASATNLASSRDFQDGDTYEVVYRLRLFAA